MPCRLCLSGHDGRLSPYFLAGVIMAGRTEEITVLVRHVRWPIAGKDFCIVDGTIIGGPSGGDPNDHNQNNQPISLVGNHEPPTDGYRSSQSEESLRELRSQCEYRFFGTWKKHAKYGRQFAFDTFVFARPHSRAAVINYLQKCPHVGHATAVAIWNQFGPDSVRVLRETPQVVADVLCVGGRFNREKAAEAAVKLASMAKLESCTMELMELLDGRKFRKTTVSRAIKRWGNRAAQMIRDNPYLLMAFPGCGFQLCDAMYLDLGHNPARTKRQVLCAWHACVKDRGGHTWLPFAEISRHIADRISGSGPGGGGGSSGDGDDIDSNGNSNQSTRAKPERAIAVGARHGIIATRRDCVACGGVGQVLEPDLWGRECQSQLFPCEACNGTGGRLWVAEGRRATDEEFVARKVAEMMRWGADWPALDHPAFERLSDHQRENLEKALRGSLCSLGGSPGVGKTFVVASLVKALINIHGPGMIGVCAPTGKAAVRCGESLRQQGVSGIEPKTIHRLLGVESNEDGEGWKFVYNSRNPLPYKTVICDECFVYEQRIWTENGKEKIGAIVNGKKTVRVWSLNKETNQFELKPIVRWIKRELKSDVIEITCAVHVSKHGTRQIRCTPDHKILTPSGYVRAGDLAVGDSVIARCVEPSQQQKSIIIGSLLGDGSLRRAAKNTPRMSFCQGIKQREYLEYKHKLAGSLASKIKRTISKSGFRDDCLTESVHFNLRCTDFTRHLFNLKLASESPTRRGQWSPSDELIESVDPLALAVWYLDDGCLDARELTDGSMSCYAHIYCNMFSENDCRRLADGLNRKFNFGCVIGSKSGYWHIAFGKEATRKLFSVIRHHVPACMSHKLDGECFAKAEYVPHAEASSVKITSIRPYTLPNDHQSKHVYDIEVADNHNYIAGNIVVSNCSMVDLPLFGSLLSAIGRGTQLLLTGDVLQLAPVGHGAPLRDLTKTIPYGEFREIRRNAGTIVRACAEIRDGIPFHSDSKIDLSSESPKNLRFVRADKHDAPRRLIELVRSLKSNPKCDPIWDVQVLVALNKSSSMGRERLNELLQNELNSDGYTVDGCGFRVGDKVVQLSNAWLELADGGKSIDEKVMVANGEFGRVLTITNSHLVVEFPYPSRKVSVQWFKRAKQLTFTEASNQSAEQNGDDKSLSGGMDLDLGYAATVWKYQGSQCPVVILVIDEHPGATGPNGNSDAHFVYTGISRAEKACFIVGKESTTHAICKRFGINKRKTFLSELLTQYLNQNRRVSTETQEANTI